ncbi:type II toxin-antitoxin system RelE/ParE family toxin [Ursidibacter arcticus]|uniref:type II toxin-antitoxin system RelE/ParE family toxin n=1 Tax=Ursidibacter arcticus TaxID=1524965 RepID=UPI003B833BE5
MQVMRKPYIISDQALKDIDEIIENVIEFTSYTASGIKLYNEIFETLELISLLPKAGRMRQENNALREMFARSYRIVYQEFDDVILIITVIHSRRLYPQPIN